MKRYALFAAIEGSPEAVYINSFDEAGTADKLNAAIHPKSPFFELDYETEGLRTLEDIEWQSPFVGNEKLKHKVASTWHFVSA